MAEFTVRTYYKKSCEQHEYFYHNDYKGPIIVKDGFRRAEFTVETNDDEFPEFDFTEVPGGDGKKDSVDLYSCFGDNVEDTQMQEMFDGGCWGDVEFPEDMDEDEQERLQEVINENGSYGLEEDGNGWSLSDTECWVWGPLEVEDEAGNVRIIIADEDGNVVDFKDE